MSSDRRAVEPVREEILSAVAEVRAVACAENDESRTRTADWLDWLFVNVADARSLREAAASALALYGGAGSFSDVGTAESHHAITNLAVALRRVRSSSAIPDSSSNDYQAVSSHPAESDSSTEQNEVAPPEFTEEDLRLGRKVCKYIDILCVSALIICAGIALFVFLNVPWNTFHPDPGKYGGYYPMQVTLALPLIGILFLGPRGRRRKPGDHHMRKGSRVASYILFTSIVLLCLWAQWVIAEQILEGGFTAPYRWEKS